MSAPDSKKPRLIFVVGGGQVGYGYTFYSPSHCLWVADWDAYCAFLDRLDG